LRGAGRRGNRLKHPRRGRCYRGATKSNGRGWYRSRGIDRNINPLYIGGIVYRGNWNNWRGEGLIFLLVN
jgi:hypothetical protein